MEFIEDSALFGKLTDFVTRGISKIYFKIHKFYRYIAQLYGLELNYTDNIHSNIKHEWKNLPTVRHGFEEF